MAHNAQTAIRWIAISELAARITAPVSFLLLARLLTPSDFGHAAIIQILIGLGTTLINDSVARFIIAEPDLSRTPCHSLRQNACILTGKIALLLAALAYPVCHYLGAVDMFPMFAVATAQLPLSAYTAFHIALLRRHYDGRTLLSNRVVQLITTAATSALLANAGLGAWSLILGQLSGVIASLLLLSTYSTPDLVTSTHKSLTQAQRRFLAASACEAAIAWSYNWADSLIAAGAFPASIVGHYRVASNAIQSIKGVTVNPMSATAMPILARLRDNHSWQRDAYIWINKRIWILVFPVSILGMLSADTVIPIILGPKWIPAIPIISLLLLNFAISWINGLSNELLAAVSQVNVASRLVLLQLVYSIPLLAFFSSKGSTAFLACRIVCTTIDVTTSLFIIRRCCGIPIGQLARHCFSILSVSLIAAIPYILLRRATFLSHSPIQCHALGIATYTIVYWRLALPQWRHLKNNFLFTPKTSETTD